MCKYLHNLSVTTKQLPRQFVSKKIVGGIMTHTQQTVLMSSYTCTLPHNLLATLHHHHAFTITYHGTTFLVRFLW
jgi:hypothetical protein